MWPTDYPSVIQAHLLPRGPVADRSGFMESAHNILVQNPRPDTVNVALLAEQMKNFLDEPCLDKTTVEECATFAQKVLNVWQSGAAG